MSTCPTRILFFADAASVHTRRWVQAVADRGGEAVVIGDRRKYLTCLITVDPDQAKKLGGDAQVRAEIQKQIDRVNQDLARVEQIKKFAVLEKAFTVETGELTPTLKLKRNVVQKKFAREIDSLYAGDEA